MWKTLFCSQRRSKFLARANTSSRLNNGPFLFLLTTPDLAAGGSVAAAAEAAEAAEAGLSPAESAEAESSVAEAVVSTGLSVAEAVVSTGFLAAVESCTGLLTSGDAAESTVGKGKGGVNKEITDGASEMVAVAAGGVNAV